MPSERPEPHSHARHAHAYLEHGADDGSPGHGRRRRPSGAIGWALVLVLGFAGVEALVGWLSGSLALLSDAVHMLTDGIALGLAFAAQLIARRRPTATHSFGYERAEPMAAFVNGLFYLVLLGAIAVEAVRRLFEPMPIVAGLALPVAVLGLLINAGMLWLLQRDRDQINTRAALLHVIGDFAGSLIAIVAITVAWTTGWTRIDPLLSLALCVLMLLSTWRVLRESARVLMNAAPDSIDVEAVARSLQSVDGVRSVHDLHVWALGGSAIALAAHVRIDRIELWPQALAQARDALRAGFGIGHVTLQPEVGADADASDGHACELRPEPIERGGLPEALRTLMSDWQLRKPQTRFELLLEPADDERFGLATQAIEAAAWRLVADAIENAVAHAGARTVVVSARRAADALTLQVSDDGRGLPGEDAPEGAGLRTMRERAQACGGSLTVRAGEAGGVEVLVRLPWPAAPAEGVAR